MNNSSLFDESTFYNKFSKDLLRAKHEVIIESPFITLDRAKSLTPIFNKLIKRGVKVYVITRDPSEHQEPYTSESEQVIQYFEQVGIQALICKGNHHRKLALVDREILWEGSLNILSQSKSREIMRRLEGKEYAQEMIDFLRLDRFL
jgi:phosphatidylserine/phosphatidylglycerophosphate/cardiolipin synthase-like enzyme